MNKIKIACALLLILAVSACGGGGGGGGSPPASPVVPFNVPTILPVAPGLNSAPVKPDTLARIETALNQVERAIGLDASEDGALPALILPTPDPIPTRRIVGFDGYIRVDGRVDGEIIVGNLNILITFSGTPKISSGVTQLREFRITGPDSFIALDGGDRLDSSRGGLTGEVGTVTGTSFISQLNIGELYLQNDSTFNVNATLEGGVYDNGDDTLLTYGTVEGTTTHSEGGNMFATGEFVGSEASDSE